MTSARIQPLGKNVISTSVPLMQQEEILDVLQKEIYQDTCIIFISV